MVNMDDIVDGCILDPHCANRAHLRGVHIAASQGHLSTMGMTCASYSSHSYVGCLICSLIGKFPCEFWNPGIVKMFISERCFKTMQDCDRALQERTREYEFRIVTYYLHELARSRQGTFHWGGWGYLLLHSKTSEAG